MEISARCWWQVLLVRVGLLLLVSCALGLPAATAAAGLCGDVDENEVVDTADLALLRAHLADPIAVPFSSAVKRKCNVIGTLRPCDILDAVVLRRAIEEPLSPPGITRSCVGNIDLVNSLRLPTRLTQGADGRVYVSDATVGSVFIYDSSLTQMAELKELATPLGVAVSASDLIYVGNNGRNNVEVYDASGEWLQSIGEGDIQMPNDLALDADGNLYVVDSLSNTIWVYEPDGSLLRSIGTPGNGPGKLSFPAAVEISYRSPAGEVYVADQSNWRVQVFDLNGVYLRQFGSRMPAFSDDWQGKFVTIQSLAMDAQNRLHAADSYQNRVQILDPETGAFIDSYGEYGRGVGELNVPLDIYITPQGGVVVTNSGNRRVETIHTIEEP